MEYLQNVPIIILHVLWLLLLYVLAVKREKRMMKYFDTKWLPLKRNVLVPKGARVLLVKEQDKQAVILWAMIRTEAILLGLSLLLGIATGFLYLTGWYIAYWRMGGNVAPVSERDFVLSLTTPFFALQIAAVIEYWLAEWERLRTRHVIRTNMHTLTDLKPTLIGFLFGRAPKPLIITERTELLKRAVTAADIEQIKPEYRTPWLRDQITYLLAGRRGIGSALLPSEVFGDRDTMRWVEMVDDYVSCLHGCADIAEAFRRSDERAGFFADQKMYRVYDETGDADKAEEARLEVLYTNEVLKERRSGESVIDIFEVPDPGLCKAGELKIVEEHIPAVISIAPRMGPQPQTAEAPAPTPTSTERGKTTDEDDDRLPRSKLV